MENINSNYSAEQIQQMFATLVAQAQAQQPKQLYECDKKGAILNNLENYVTFLNNSDYTKGKIKYNQFLERKEFEGKEYTDFIESAIMLRMAKELKFDPSTTKFTTAITNVFNNNQYNPTVDYLDSLEWDGTPRIETIFIDWLGAADTKLIREMSRKWMIAAVKRVYDPGCKFDNMIVLKGPQGCGKSTICERLAHGFYNEHINIEDPKYYVETLNRSWIACFDELSGISRKDLADIKSFLSKSEDTVRLAYARNPQTYKRHCIFIGSTNEENFLRDFTASIERRFWVIECTRDNTNNIVGLGFNDYIVNQLWAEAVSYYKNDKNQFLDLSVSGINDLMIEQQKFKTSNTDEVIDYVRDMINTEYILDDQGEFINEDDFYEQYSGFSNKVGLKRPIKKIPTRYIKYVLYKKYKESRTPSYISSVLKDDITYKVSRYKNVSTKCYIIKNTENENNMNNKDNEMISLFN